MPRLSPAVLALSLMAAMAATPAAANPRAFVASTGSDANTASSCGQATPCRTIAAAHSVVDPGGIILALDGAGYGIVTITKSVTIAANPGFYAGMGNSTGSVITIATANVIVTLRGLNIDSTGAAYGINMTNGAKLSIENCIISNFTNTGVNVTTAATVRVTDTTIRDNGNIGLLLQDGARATVTRAMISGNGNAGVFVFGTVASTTTTADIADSTMGGSVYGVGARSTDASAVLKVSVRDSRVVGNSGYGVDAASDAGAAVTLSVSNNMISNNVFGIAAHSAGSKVWASGNTVSDNGVGLYNLNGLFESAGNNAVRNNTSFDTSGTITAIATM